MSSSPPHDDSDITEVVPLHIGRYRVEKPIGRGGFGTVYLAYDTELERQVAIKIPHRKLVEGRDGAEEYLKEARMVAHLDHPNIVPVYDVGSSDEFECFVVSKFIPGQDLGKVLRDHRFTYLESVELIVPIADALHHAHKRGIVHRDVKPSNILIDSEGKPYLADFGLALPERSLGTGFRYAGTPAYMSPEQARGEGHRVDGRSDIFSLGAVLYELVTGKRAFRGETRSDLFNVVENFEPRPLRQYDENIPKELDRICQKALSKRASERYSTAHDLAEELRIFISSSGKRSQTSTLGSTINFTNVAAESTNVSKENLEQATPSSARSATEQISVSQAIAVVPKGLRSFDAQDSDFFLELLPGPRGRDGLPENLRFWKDRIEAMDADESFSVGLIYGPSGCGKSSFVKAGLIPRLAHQIVPVFIESSSEFTEKRLLQALHKVCPDIDPKLNISDAIATIRRGGGIPPGRKVLLVFDQFEQWLHSNQGSESHELFKALRQCDGERVQAILLVRSDFWMAVMWFLNDLEIELVQGRNFAAIDLFPPRHAEKVLVAFGRAFGALPADGKLDSNQMAFIRQSVEGLTQDGKVMCVRLAVYAEMMKNKPWTPASLKQIGGTEGVGVSFLEESFGPQANPRARLHQRAARSVMKSLLPDSGTLINIQLKSYDELFTASGYSDTKQFDDLIRVLDGEMRLISPTDPLGVSQGSNDAEASASLDPSKKYYRLSHDYLVNALRNWLNRKQRETRQGRAELLLEERASYWTAKHESRFLPSLLEYARIQILTPRNQWTGGQKAMMRAATKTYSLWVGGAAIVLALCGLGTFILQEKMKADRASTLVGSLLKNAEIERVGDSIVELKDYRNWANALLLTAFKNNPAGSREKLHAAIALQSESQECHDYLVAQLPFVDARQFTPVCNALKTKRVEAPREFVELVLDPASPARARLQAACAVAQLDRKHAIWQDNAICNFVAEDLTRLYPSELMPLRQALLPVASSINPHLQAIFLDRNRNQQQRLNATESLVDYANGNVQELFDLLLDCDEIQFPLVFRALGGRDKAVIDLAKKEMEKSIAMDADEPDKEVLAEHQGNAAVALYLLATYEPIWSKLNAVENPRTKSFIIHWLSNRGANPKALLARLQTEENPTSRQALLLALGEYTPESFEKSDLDSLISISAELMKNSPTSDLRAAALWTLHSIGQGAMADDIESEQMDRSRENIESWSSKFAEAKSRLTSVEGASADRQKALEDIALAQIKTSLDKVNLSDSYLVPLHSKSELIPFEGKDLDGITVAKGVVGDSIWFDGNSKARTSLSLPVFKDDIAYGGWFKLEVGPQWRSLFSRMDVNDNLKGFDFWTEEGKLCAHIKNRFVESESDEMRHWIKIKTIESVNDGFWHHGFATYDGSGDAAGLKIYLDGKPAAVEVLFNTMSGDFTVSSDLIVGGRPDTLYEGKLTGWEFHGALSDLRFFDRALSAEEVHALYLSSIRGLIEMDRRSLDVSQARIVDEAAQNPDPELLGAQENWEQLAKQQTTEMLSSKSDWYYTSQRQWMIRVPCTTFVMGSPNTEWDRISSEYQVTQSIDRIIALSAHEVTVGQWREFLRDFPPAESQQQKYKNMAIEELDADLAMVNINWFEAVNYCNWLNEREGIPESQWCYVPNAEQKYGVGMKAKPEFWKLSGYRLPTQSEWEFACRAGSSARRCYGSSDALLSKYAWFQNNSQDRVHRPGTLKPNLFGFFDMHGNAAEWCFDLHDDYPYRTTESRDEPKVVESITTAPRSIRGGGFYDMSKYVRSAHRYSWEPEHVLAVSGLRMARTLRDSIKGD